MDDETRVYVTIAAIIIIAIVIAAVALVVTNSAPSGGYVHFKSHVIALLLRHK
jgi:uncharacterized membrane protein